MVNKEVWGFFLFVFITLTTLNKTQFPSWEHLAYRVFVSLQVKFEDHFAQESHLLYFSGLLCNCGLKTGFLSFSSSAVWSLMQSIITFLVTVCDAVTE